jgi:hypothetical protein
MTPGEEDSGGDKEFELEELKILSVRYEMGIDALPKFFLFVPRI